MSDAIKSCNTCGRQFKGPEDFLQNTSRWRICDRGNLWFNCACQSTSMIIKGKFDWYKPEDSLSPGAKSVFNQLAAIKELPHMPHYVMQLQELIQQEGTSSKQLADVAKKAPILASNILDIANNKISVSGNSIESLEHAISYIGLSTLKDMVLIAALNTFKFSCSKFNAEEFWEGSFLCGRISELLARKFAPDLLSDEAYIAGTLANCGKIVQAITDPDMADQIHSDINDVSTLGSWVQAERRNSSHSHTVLGEIACMFWGLPVYVSEVAANHHRTPQSLIKGQFTNEDIVTFANQLSHWVMLRPTQMDEHLLEACYEKFGLSHSDAEDLMSELMPLKAAS